MDAGAAPETRFNLFPSPGSSVSCLVPLVLVFHSRTLLGHVLCAPLGRRAVGEYFNHCTCYFHEQRGPLRGLFEVDLCHL